MPTDMEIRRARRELTNALDWAAQVEYSKLRTKDSDLLVDATREMISALNKLNQILDEIPLSK